MPSSVKGLKARSILNRLLNHDCAELELPVARDYAPIESHALRVSPTSSAIARIAHVVVARLKPKLNGEYSAQQKMEAIDELIDRRHVCVPLL